jgi:hypothetical protein
MIPGTPSLQVFEATKKKKALAKKTHHEGVRTHRLRNANHASWAHTT